MATREEKLAQLVLRKHNLKPPYDLIALVQTKAKISFKAFPFRADGITVDIKSKKPQIFINSLVNSSARKNFTIAHELGHVCLPWHKGTIVSEDNYSSSHHLIYREMEAEANRFASELLMPSDWVKTILIEDNSFASKLHQVIFDAKVSLEAALIKISNLCTERRYILQLDGNDICTKEYKALNIRNLNYIGKKFEPNNIIGISQLEKFVEKGTLIQTFVLEYDDVSEFNNQDSREWREILREILNDCNCVDKTKNVNAISNYRVNELKKQGVTDVHFICGEVKIHFNGRSGLEDVVKHDLFSIYIRKRVDSLLRN